MATDNNGPGHDPVEMCTAITWRADLEDLFNEWMRRYTKCPEEFRRQWQTVGDFLTEQANGGTPSYGKRCVAYLMRLANEADKQ